MRKSIWVALAATLALSSCFKTAETWTITGDNPVVFSEKVERYAGTRAMDGHPVENVPNQPTKGLIPIGKSFGVWAWSHEDETATAFDELQNEQVTRAANNGGEAVYTYSPTAKWPNQQLSFLAYYPYSASSDAAANGGMSTPPTVANDGTTMTIPYTVPTAGEKHIDLMYARKGETEGYDPVELEFRHALSRMKFSALIDGFSGSDKVRVTGIKLIGATLAGTLTVPVDKDEAATWALGSTKGDITVADGRGERPDHILDSDLSATMQSLITATGASTTAGDLIVLPQDVKGMSLEITATLNGNEYEPYIIPLAAAPRMLMNFIYNYRIVLTPKDVSLYVEVIPWGEGMNEDSEFDGQYFLRVNRSRFEFGSAPGAAELTVATDHPDDWTITDVQGNTDNWLTIDPQAGEGNGDETPVTLTVAENTTGGQREATFNVKAGNLKKTIHVVQKPEPVLTATTPSNFARAGGTRNTTVVSHDGSPAQNPVAWEVVEYSIDGTTWTPGTPDYLSIDMTGNGTMASKAYGVTMKQQTRQIFEYNADDNILRGRSKVGTSDGGEKDLSGGGETANSYIVNAPGYYKLPLYYGNARNNPEAYAGPNFVNHNGDPIDGNAIQNVDNAVLVWQDCLNLLTEIDTDGAFLTFYVDPETICQGNAVVAVRNAEDVILWSWHIWVTPLVNRETPDYYAITNRAVMTGPTRVETAPYKTNKFMQFSLGEKKGRREIKFGEGDNYDQDRVVWIRIRQTGIENPASAEFKVTQRYGILSISDNSPYWQWGRKDALPPSSGENAEGSIEWNEKEGYVWAPTSGNAGSGLTGLANAIQNPHKFFATSSVWYSGKNYSNLWDADNTVYGVAALVDNEVVKTVYDPCPPGFKMPPGDAWTGFFRTTVAGPATQDRTDPDGWSWFNDSASKAQNATWGFRSDVVYYSPYLNVSNLSTFLNDGGWYFYSEPNDATSTNGTPILFRAFGTRSTNINELGEPGYVGDNLIYWTAVPNSEAYGSILRYNHSRPSTAQFYPVHTSSQAIAASVRPVKNEPSQLVNP